MSEALEFSLDPYLAPILGRKAANVVVLDVRKLTSIADVFIICSGASHRQVSAIAEHVQAELKKRKIRALSVDGAREGQWALLDYGQVIIHVFHDPVREFYDLEGLWADAPRLKPPALARVRDHDPEEEPEHG